MNIDKLESCDDCSFMDYLAIGAFILFPPFGLYLLLLRKNEWKHSNLLLIEKFFVAASILEWIFVFNFNNNWFYGCFTANVALFFSIAISSFLGVEILANDYFARIIISGLSSVVGLEMSISLAHDWNKTLSINSCSSEMLGLSLVGLVFFAISFMVLPIVSNRTSLLEGLIGKQTPITLDWIYIAYSFLLIVSLIFPFFYTDFPNFVGALFCF